jgi:uncharacterized membrane protein
MAEINPHSTIEIAGHPIHPMLIPFPIAFFVGALAADIVFAANGNPFWGTAAVWLLIAGLVMAVLAALAGVTDFLSDGRIRQLNPAWRHLIGNVVAVVIEIVNLWLRLARGPDFVLPVGLILSAVVTLLLLYTGWQGWEMVYRDRVGVKPEGQPMA